MLITLNGNYKLIGSRADNNFSTFPSERVTLGSYGLLDLNIFYDLNSKTQLFVRGNNVFDKEYEDVYGFGTLGAAYYAGVKVNI